MKSIVIIINCIIVSSCAFFHKNIIVDIYKIDVTELGVDSAYNLQLQLKAQQGALSDCEFGSKNAIQDFKKQIYYYYSEELLMPSYLYFDILKQDYNVNWQFQIDLFSNEYYDCYNEEIRKLLKKKYGFDVFDRAYKKAKSFEN